MKHGVFIGVGVVVLLALVAVFLLPAEEEVEVMTKPEPQPPEQVDFPTVGDKVFLPETSWVWVETVYAERDTVTPNEPGSFVLSFIDEGRFGAQTDCNNVGGAYVRSVDQIRFEQMMATKMACMNETQEAEFSTMLGSVETITTDQENRLILGLANDVGYMTFTFIEG